MKVVVKYNLLDPTKQLMDSLRYNYSKEFASLDEAYEWIDTTNDAIMNMSVEVSE